MKIPKWNKPKPYGRGYKQRIRKGQNLTINGSKVISWERIETPAYSQNMIWFEANEADRTELLLTP